MKVELVPSTVGESASLQYCTTFLIDGCIAIDAGTLGLLHPLSRQTAVRQVFLSHCHLDHLATLPLFLDNVLQPGEDCVTVYANEATRECLVNDIFNDRLWPDFLKLSEGDTRFLELEELNSEQPVQIGEHTITPVSLDHNVPTMGFCIENRDHAVGLVYDTSPTERVWEILAAKENLSAVFLECSFPDSHRWLADEASHLCPELFAAELAKLGRDVDVYVCHIKPQFYDEVVCELGALALKNIRIAAPGTVYDIPGASAATS